MCNHKWLQSTHSIFLKSTVQIQFEVIRIVALAKPHISSQCWSKIDKYILIFEWYLIVGPFGRKTSQFASTTIEHGSIRDVQIWHHKLIIVRTIQIMNYRISRGRYNKILSTIHSAHHPFNKIHSAELAHTFCPPIDHYICKEKDNNKKTMPRFSAHFFLLYLRIHFIYVFVYYCIFLFLWYRE